MVRSVFKGTGNLFPGNGSHAACHKVAVHYAQHAWIPIDFSGSPYHRFLLSAVLPSVFQLFVIAGKIDQVYRLQLLILFVKAVPVRQNPDALPGGNLEMMAALPAHKQILS